MSKNRSFGSFFYFSISPEHPPRPLFCVTWRHQAPAGSRRLARSGTLRVSGVNTYTGATPINGGTLLLTRSGQISPSSALSLAGSGATLDLSASAAQVISGLSGVTDTRALFGANALTVNTAGDSFKPGSLWAEAPLSNKVPACWCSTGPAQHSRARPP